MEVSQNNDVVLSVNLQSPVTQKPFGYGPFTEKYPATTSMSGPSFMRQQRENAAPCYPGADWMCAL